MARRTGTATLPLHSGRAPRWLFQRMTRPAGAEADTSIHVAGGKGKAEIADFLGCFEWLGALKQLAEWEAA